MDYSIKAARDQFDKKPLPYLMALLLFVIVVLWLQLGDERQERDKINQELIKTKDEIIRAKDAELYSSREDRNLMLHVIEIQKKVLDILTMRADSTSRK